MLSAGFGMAYGPEVRVNTIMAGPFLSDIASEWDIEPFEKHARGFPLHRAGKPDEIVGAALYLASPTASSTTGRVISVDGSRSIARL